jgi:hypothetical protein
MFLSLVINLRGKQQHRQFRLANASKQAEEALSPLKASYSYCVPAYSLPRSISSISKAIEALHKLVTKAITPSDIMGCDRQTLSADSSVSMRGKCHRISKLHARAPPGD